MQGMYISLTPSPWTTTMDYRNGLLNGLPIWTTKMDYPKLPTFKKKKKISKAWLFIDRFPQVLSAISAILFYKCCWSAVLQAHSFVARDENLVCLAPQGMCGPKGYGFLAVLVRNRVSILAILVLNRVWFLQTCLELSMLVTRSYFFIIIDKTINKSPSQCH